MTIPFFLLYFSHFALVPPAAAYLIHSRWRSGTEPRAVPLFRWRLCRLMKAAVPEASALLICRGFHQPFTIPTLSAHYPNDIPKLLLLLVLSPELRSPRCPVRLLFLFSSPQNLNQSRTAPLAKILFSIKIFSRPSYYFDKPFDLLKNHGDSASRVWRCNDFAFPLCASDLRFPIGHRAKPSLLAECGGANP